MNIKFIILSLSIILLSACKQEAQLEPTKKLSVGKGDTHNTVKPHAPVSMEYSFISTPEINKVLEVRLDFKVSRDTPHLKVVYHTTTALKSVDTVQQFELYNLHQGSIEPVFIQVLVEQPGKHLIYVSASMDINGISQSRAFVVPVNIAGATQQLKSEKSDQSNGMKYLPEQNVISMPASVPPNN